MKYALLAVICCACYEQPPPQLTFGPGPPPPRAAASLDELLHALPTNAPIVIAIDGASLRGSVLAQNLWRRMAALPEFAARFGDPCMQTFTTTDRMVIAAPPSFSQVVAIDQGLSQAAIAKCRDQPAYQRLLTDTHTEWKVWDRYEAIADATNATQLSWVGPELSVIVHGPVAKQVPTEDLWVVGARIGRAGMQGPLDRPEVQRQLPDIKLDRTAPVWGLMLAKTGIVLAASVHVTEVADFDIVFRTESPAAATELAERLAKLLEEGRLNGMISVGFATANGDQVAVKAQLSEAQVWEWLVKQARAGSHRKLAAPE
ncbi:MAG TPA: hypothetical protein VIV58_16790 [Kofleriaceae bacterium]